MHEPITLEPRRPQEDWLQQMRQHPKDPRAAYEQLPARPEGG